MTPCNSPSQERPSGLLRLSLAQCRRLRLAHLVSGLDEESPGERLCGSATSLRGYTEWVSLDEPSVTLGWDWQLLAEGGTARCVRVGQPFSNVLLVDAQGVDFDAERNLDALAGLVDSLPWSGATRDAVSRRYG